MSDAFLWSLCDGSTVASSINVSTCGSTKLIPTVHMNTVLINLINQYLEILLFACLTS